MEFLETFFNDFDILVVTETHLDNKINDSDKNLEGPGWLNELGSWITCQLIQAYHQYGMGSRPAL